MKIEKLNENKIRITLNLQDLENKNIDFHSFMSNSIESQTLFLDMLNEAEKEIGFITDNYKIAIEALAMSDGNFVLTVTRLAPEIQKMKRRVAHTRRKSSNSSFSNVAIYKFNTFDDFLEFCVFLDSSMLKALKNLIKDNDLYELNNHYYLVFNNISLNPELLNSLYSSLTEFSTHINNCDTYKSKLKEYGTIIMPNNAIETCLQYF